MAEREITESATSPVSHDPPYESTKVHALPATTPCPSCGKSFSSSKFCTHCGHGFGTASVLSGLVSPVPEPKVPEPKVSTLEELLLPKEVIAPFTATKADAARVSITLKDSDTANTPEAAVDKPIAITEPVLKSEPHGKPVQVEVPGPAGEGTKSKKSSSPLFIGIVVGVGIAGAVGYMVLKPPVTEPPQQPVVAVDQQTNEGKEKDPLSGFGVLPQPDSPIAQQTNEIKEQEYSTESVVTPRVEQPLPAPVRAAPSATTKKPNKPIKQATITEPPVTEVPRVAPAPTPVPHTPARSIDDMFLAIAEQKCGKRPSGYFERIPWTVCAEPTRFVLCNGKWHEGNHPGEEICKVTNTPKKN